MANEATPHAVVTGRDNDGGKGGMEPDSRKQESNNSLAGQLPHRDADALKGATDSDTHEPGQQP